MCGGGSIVNVCFFARRNAAIEGPESISAEQTEENHSSTWVENLLNGGPVKLISGDIFPASILIPSVNGEGSIGGSDSSTWCGGACDGFG